jgi:hypothetical protein
MNPQQIGQIGYRQKALDLDEMKKPVEA